jgi:CheY-like chemotaxis protein
MQRFINGHSTEFKVLIVEDMPVQAMQFKTLLEAIGCQVSWVSNGKDGVATASGEAFDLIVLDIGLPDIDGFDVLQQLKAEAASRGKDIPVVLLTTHDEAESVLQGLDLGAVDYIPKDVFAEIVLRETVEHMMKTKAE